jgi:BirA family transcriptional regulator, biotin operon repressor / biotin---[acetyl-CoA-carboxylase] ligase
MFLENNMLNADAIRSYLPSDKQTLLSPITVFQTLHSTSTYLLELPLSEKKSGYVCLAEEQTAGRGQRGRHWVSPHHENIYISVLWEIPLEKRNGMSLIIALAIVQLLKKIGIQEAQIKHPNDVLVKGKKLAGILIEGVGNYVVIGVGINVNMRNNTDIDQPWTSISNELGSNIDRNQIAGLFLDFLSEQLCLFETRAELNA